MGNHIRHMAAWLAARSGPPASPKPPGLVSMQVLDPKLEDPVETREWAWGLLPSVEIVEVHCTVCVEESTVSWVLA